MSDRPWANRFESVRRPWPVVAVTRRVVMVAMLAVVGGLALSGCRTDPAVAAYIGDEVITVAQVDAIVNDLNAKIAAARADAEAKGQPTDGQAPAPRVSQADVLIQLVIGRACAIAQAKDHFSSTAISAEQVAQQQGIPSNTLFAQERATTETCLSGIQVQTAQVPTVADVRDIYDRADASFEVTATFEEIRDQLIADPDIRKAVGAKRIVQKMVQDANVVINPQYRPLEYGVSDLGNQEQVPLVVAVLSPGSDAVVDVS